MDIENLDLTNKEDLTKFNNIVDDLKDSDTVNSILSLFGVDSGMLDSLKDVAQNVYDEAHKNDVEEEIPPFELPSSKLTTEQGLQLHKITQEYIDTMIKPYNNGKLSTKQINDAYAELYEFASWILLR
jgi:hypothetical protein